jgi:hypothetical protein
MAIWCVYFNEDDSVERVEREDESPERPPDELLAYVEKRYGPVLGIKGRAAGVAFVRKTIEWPPKR